MEAFGVRAKGFGGGVVERVGEALADVLVYVGVDVILETEHVGGGQSVPVAEDVDDAIGAEGIDPVVGDRPGVVVGGDARVGGGQITIDGVCDGG